MALYFSVIQCPTLILKPHECSELPQRKSPLERKKVAETSALLRGDEIANRFKLEVSPIKQYKTCVGGFPAN